MSGILPYWCILSAKLQTLLEIIINLLFQGRNADALALYFGEDPSRCPFEQGIFSRELLVLFIELY